MLHISQENWKRGPAGSIYRAQESAPGGQESHLIILVSEFKLQNQIQTG